MKTNQITVEFPLQLSDGREVKLAVQEMAETFEKGRSFVFALHKSGSVLLNSMICDVAKAVGLPVVDLPGFLFSQGIMIPEVMSGTREIFSQKYVFGGFRQFPQPALEVGDLFESKSILLVRDPRDILVSLYFSMLKSHPVPESGAVRELLLARRKRASQVDIDEYAREQSVFVIRELQRYDEHLCGKHPEMCRIFRYEDVIFEKPRWLNDICEWFGWEVDRSVIDKVAQAHDIRPPKENDGAHIRRVTPGDHREKLSAETIGWLNEKMAGAAAPFGYHLA